LQDTYAVLPQNGEAQLRIFNSFNCSVIVDVPGVITDNKIEPLNFWSAPTLQADGEKIYPLNIRSDACSYVTFDGNVTVTEMQVTKNKYMMRTQLRFLLS